MADPLVSIITPTFNRAELLRRAWRSMRDESASFEWIIVDDASSDSTEAVVKSFGDPRTVFMRLDRNQGSNIARNHGLRVARGRFVLFLDSDDELAPDSLTDAVQTIGDAPPNIGAVLMIAQPVFTQVHNAALPDGAILNEEDLVIRNRLSGDHAVIYRREVFDRQMLPEEYRESQFVFVYGISRWWSFLVANRPLTLVHRQDDNLSQASSISRRSTAIAMGWEAVISNHAVILGRNAPARLRIYGRVLYRYGVAGDWKAVRRTLNGFRSCDPRISAQLKAAAFVVAGVIGRFGGDYIRLTLMRIREKGVLRPAGRAPEFS